MVVRIPSTSASMACGCTSVGVGSSRVNDGGGIWNVKHRMLCTGMNVRRSFGKCILVSMKQEQTCCVGGGSWLDLNVVNGWYALLAVVVYSVG